MTKTQDETIQAILAVDEACERARFKPVERFELLGTDGKWYAGSMPLGVHYAEQRRPYWVLQAHDGCTVGVRHTTEAALTETLNKSITGRLAGFESQLRIMNAKQLADQAAYWLKAKSA